MRLLLIAFLFLSLLYACESGTQTAATEVNPAAPGFNATASDAEAIELADAVMNAMGGRRAWDTTRYFKWNFFGSRTLTWDKQAQRVRIESDRDSTIYLVDLKNETGRVQQAGQELTIPDSLAKMITRGRNIWINDSYWLVMPFKLKDSGVTLTYVGADKLTDGSPVEVLELTFAEVGVTPQNKYHVYVDQKDNLIKQWAFYRNATDAEPAFTTPRVDYERHGDLLLSGNRGQRQLSNISVSQEMPESVFTEF